jgi:putative transcriptional regulator
MHFHPFYNKTVKKTRNNLIKEKRTARGLPQENLAEMLEFSRRTTIPLEKGRYNPSLVFAFKIARLFNCRLEDIFRPEEWICMKDLKRRPFLKL